MKTTWEDLTIEEVKKDLRGSIPDKIHMPNCSLFVRLAEMLPELVDRIGYKIQKQEKEYEHSDRFAPPYTIISYRVVSKTPLEFLESKEEL